MAPCCSKDELLDLALEVINPPVQKKASCRLALQDALKIVDMVRVLDEAPGAGEFKRRVKAFADSLKKTKGALANLHKTTQNLVFRGLPESVGPVDEIRFADDLGLLIETCEFLIESVKTPPGSRRWSAVKFTCALHARNLLRDFSPSRPTQCKEGPLFQLASLLFEISGGEEGSDLSGYCENPDRVVPLYVAKIPNVRGL